MKGGKQVVLGKLLQSIGVYICCPRVIVNLGLQEIHSNGCKLLIQVVPGTAVPGRFAYESFRLRYFFHSLTDVLNVERKCNKYHFSFLKRVAKAELRVVFVDTSV